MALSVDGSSVPVVVVTKVSLLEFVLMYWGGVLPQRMGHSVMKTKTVVVTIAKMVYALRVKCGYGLWQLALELLSFCLL